MFKRKATIMSKRTSNSRLSISSGTSIPASIDNIKSFEEYLSLAQDMPAATPPEPPPPPAPKKESKKSSKYGINILLRNKAAVQKSNNFVEINKQVEKPPPPPAPPQHQGSWRNLIKGVLDLQRGKIPLLLAVEAGNQSMVRELLSAQTAEQLQVSFGY